MSHRRRRRGLAALVAGLALLAPAGARADDLQHGLAVAAHQWGITQPVTVLWDQTLRERTGFAGEASGIRVELDGVTWTLLRYEITLDLDDWATATSYQRCLYVVHEVGHLAMQRHTLTGVMAPRPGDLPACLPPEPPPTPRDLAEQAVRRRSPPGSFVSCIPNHRRTLLACRSERMAATRLWRVVRYRATVHGDRVTVTRRADRRDA